MKKRLDLEITKEYRVKTDKKLIGTIIIMIATTMMILLFVKIPVVSTFNAYTVGMVLGNFSPFFYMAFMYYGLAKILNNPNPISKYLKISKKAALFIGSTFIFATVVWVHYFWQENLYAIGRKPWSVFSEWWNHFSKNQDYLYPKMYLGGLYGAFLYAITSSALSNLGAGVVSIIFILVSISLLFFESWVGMATSIWKLMFSPKQNIRTTSQNPVINDMQGVSLQNPTENIIVKTSEISFIKEEQQPKEEDFKSLKNKIQLELQSDDKEASVDLIKQEIETLKSEAIIESPFDVPLTAKELLEIKKYSVSMELLDDVDTTRVNEKIQHEVIEKSHNLDELFKSFKIDAHVIDSIVGPTLTKYIIKTGPGTNLKKIATIEDNIKMNLATTSIRMELPIPGQSAIGIECPNAQPQMVSFKSVYDKINSKEYSNLTLPAALGILIDGTPLIIDISKTPHLLIAGATGSGKSVGINSIIISLLMKFSPHEVAIILIDPKMVEFTPYEGIRHLYKPIVTDAVEAAKTLDMVVELMEERYSLMSRFKVRKFEEWNEKAESISQKKWPYLVVIIDELADLMNVAKSSVEVAIQRITQKARAAGIHLIVATQRPSTDVVTGVIKANIPSRISFSVTSSIDSKVILDAVGAEKLLGHGDLLISLYGMHIQRAQGAFLSNREIERVSKVIQGTPPYPQIKNTEDTEENMEVQK